MRNAIVLACATALVACGATPRPRAAAARTSDGGNPLGPSYVLMPLPGEDDSLLGRVIPGAPEAGRTLEEVARANPCAEHLGEKRETPLASTFEYAEELAGSASAGALLGTFGFSADARKATHFVYELGTDKRVSVVDAAGYAACCAEKGCGYGYVSALIHGNGQYATGEESGASGGVDIPAIASASGEVSLRVLNKRKVSGYIAAVVTITDRNASQPLGPLGVAQEAGITEASVGETTKAIYEKEKVAIAPREDEWVFTLGRTVGGQPQELHENDFIELYAETTGSDELQDLYGRRNTAGVITFSALALGGGLGFCGGGLAAGGGGDADGAVVAGCGLGLGFFLGFGIPAIVMLASYDGSVTSHHLTERDAQLYVHRYNRALLRRTVRDVEKIHRDSALPPRNDGFSIGLTADGFAGTF